MNLFGNHITDAVNLLPRDGTVQYYPNFLSGRQAAFLLQHFSDTIAWKPDELIIFGRRIITKRMVAWYGDAGMAYKYSGMVKTALPWTDELLALKSTVEAQTGNTFNSCLLNLYHNGTEGMGWHSDDEKELQKDGAIASVSLGAVRKFVFKHKHTHETVHIMLEQGSLLLMQGATQTHWLHRLPPSAAVTSARINLTFRTIVPGQ